MSMSTQGGSTMYEPVNYVDYPWIQAWGRLLGFGATWINETIEAARQAQAPPAAIYPIIRDTTRWVTLEQVVDPATRSWLIEYAADQHLFLPTKILAHWADPGFVPSMRVYDHVDDAPASPYEQVPRRPALYSPEDENDSQSSRARV